MCSIMECEIPQVKDEQTEDFCTMYWRGRGMNKQARIYVYETTRDEYEMKTRHL